MRCGLHTEEFQHPANYRHSAIYDNVKKSHIYESSAQRVIGLSFPILDKKKLEKDILE